MFIITHKNIFIGISAVLFVAAIAVIVTLGLPLGIDFRGGAQLEIAYTEAPELSVVQNAVTELNFGVTQILPSGETGYFVKTRDLTESEHVQLVSALSTIGSDAKEVGFTSIGPSVGSELARKSIFSIILVSLAIVLFIAFAFRKVSQPIASWKYGVTAIITLLHDITIPVGIFAILARVYGFEVDTLFVVALLTVLGLSVSDTIVIFDRIRENLKDKVFGTFEETVGNSIKQTYVRSINTSMTTIFVLLALFFFGPESTKIFSLIMASGMFLGTYSSIFLASPLLVTIAKMQKK